MRRFSFFGLPHALREFTAAYDNAAPPKKGSMARMSALWRSAASLGGVDLVVPAEKGVNLDVPIVSTRPSAVA